MPRPRLDRPQGPASCGPSSTRMRSSVRLRAHQHPSGWHSNQPATGSSYAANAGKYFDGSAAVRLSESSKPASSATFTSGYSATPTQFKANPSTASGFQQQNMLSSHVAPQQNLLPSEAAPQQNLSANQVSPWQNLMPGQMAPQQNFTSSQAAPHQNLLPSQAAPGMLPLQSAVSSSSAYGWSNSTSAAQWQTQSQWPWVQGNNQWTAQSTQYMVCRCHSHIYSPLTTGDLCMAYVRARMSLVYLARNKLIHRKMHHFWRVFENMFHVTENSRR